MFVAVLDYLLFLDIESFFTDVFYKGLGVIYGIKAGIRVVS